MADRSIRKPIYETYEKIANELIEPYNIEEYDKKKLEALAKEIYDQFIQINNKLIWLKYQPKS